MISSKVAKNIISVILAVVTLFFGVYVVFARVQAAEVSFVDDTVDYYFDDDGFIHAVYQDRDTACQFKVSDLNQSWFAYYCYAYDCINDVIWVFGYSSSDYDNYLKSVIFNYSPSVIYRDFVSSTSVKCYVAFYNYNTSGIATFGCDGHSDLGSRYFSFRLSDWLSYYLNYGYTNISDSIYLIPLYSNTNWKGSFAVDGSLLSNVPADYQYNYIYYDPNTTYYTFLTWSVPVGSYIGATFYSQGGAIGTYKIYTSQNGSDWSWHDSGFAGTFTFSGTYLGENISPIYYSDDYGRTGANNDNFPEDFSIEDTMENLSDFSYKVVQSDLYALFSVVQNGNQIYYPKDSPNFYDYFFSQTVYLYNCQWNLSFGQVAEGPYQFCCFDSNPYTVGDSFDYYFYASVDPSTHNGDYYQATINNYTVSSIETLSTFGYLMRTLNNNINKGFKGLNSSISALNDNIGAMLSSVHLRLGNIYTRLGVTNDYLDSMNGSLSTLNTAISNGFDDVISAINGSESSGSVDLSGVEDKINSVNSNLDEWQLQFTGFSLLLWIALGFDPDEAGGEDPNFPSIIDFIQGAITGSAIGTALGYFNSFDTDTMNGIHFVNDTLTTIWTTCAPLQPLLVGGAVLLVAGMIVKRN